MTTTLQDLSDEILVDIFQHLLTDGSKGLVQEELLKVGCVCRDFKRISDDRQFWRDINLSPHPTMSLATVGKLLSRASHMRSLNVAASQTVNADYLADILKASPLISTLIADFLRIPRSLLADSRVGNPYLRHVSLAYSGLTNDCIETLCENNGTLTYLNVRQCGDLTDACLPALAQAQNLRYLDVSGCWRFNDEALGGALRELKGLTSLVAFGCVGVGALTIGSLAESGSGSLTSIDVGGCSSIGPASLSALVSASGGRNLRRAFLPSTVSDELLMGLAVSHARTLQALDLTECSEVTSDGIAAIATSCSALKVLLLDTVINLKDAAVAAVARNCPALEVLDIAGCGDVTSAAIVMIAESCPSLRYLNMRQCMKVGRTAMEALARHSKKLEELNLCCLVNVRFPQVLAILEGCPSLRVLDLSLNSWVTDEAVSVLAGPASRLDRLVVSHCKNLSKGGVESLGLPPKVVEFDRLFKGTRWGGTSGTSNQSRSTASYVQRSSPSFVAPE